MLNTYTINYTTLPDLLGSPLSATPTAVRGLDQFILPSSTTGASVSSATSASLVGDAAYVGNAARDQLFTRTINGRPYGYAYQASSLIPRSSRRTGAAASRRSPAAVSGLRTRSTSANSPATRDYHSLQASTTRRRAADGLTFGASYTYEIVNKTLGAIDPFLPDNRAQDTTRLPGTPSAQRSRSTTRTRCRTSSQKLEQHLRQGDVRQLAGLGYHVDPERTPRQGFTLRLHRRADRRA